MPTRRQVILTFAALTGGAFTHTALSVHHGASRYDEAVRNIWQRPSGNPNIFLLSINRELVRHASLAASSHNTQCWKFRIEDHAISVLPDPSRRGYEPKTPRSLDQIILI